VACPNDAIKLEIELPKINAREHQKVAGILIIRRRGFG
jgi:hypothetical protein